MKIHVIIIVILLCTISSTISAQTGQVDTHDELPSSFCWCDINGIDYTTPIKNQAPAPTCEAYALLAAVETLVQYKVGEPFGCDLSETHLYFYAGGTVAAGGVHLQDAADYLVEHGVPDEGCFPDPHRPYDPDTPYESVQGWENRTVKITEWGWVDQRRDSMKQALVEHGPLIICIVQRKDFLTYSGGIYRPHWWQTIQNGHVVSIVGYDDEQQCWILRNSAGTDWGENGYARVAYDAHTADTPIIWPFYGGSGVMYVDGVYGTFQPDVPQAYIIGPQNHYFQDVCSYQESQITSFKEAMPISLLRLKLGRISNHSTIILCNLQHIVISSRKPMARLSPMVYLCIRLDNSLSITRLSYDSNLRKRYMLCVHLHHRHLHNKIMIFSLNVKAVQ